MRMLWFQRNEPRFFFAAMAMLLLPVWATEGWYSFDGPAHLYNAEVIGELIWGEESEFLKSYYRLRWPPAPNLLYYIVTAPLTRFLAPEWIDKLWASLHVLVFGLGFRFFLLKLSGGVRLNDAGRYASWASWVGLYGVFHKHFFLGQYNFSMSIGLLWWTLGYCWHWLSNLSSYGSSSTRDKAMTRDKAVTGEEAIVGQEKSMSNLFRTLWPLLRIGGFLTLLGISHLVGFAAAGISIAVMLMWFFGIRMRQMLKAALYLLTVALPALAINLSYLWQSSGTGPTRFIGIHDLIWQWLSLDAFTSFNPPVEWRSMAGIFLIGILSLPLTLIALVRKRLRHRAGIEWDQGSWAYLLTCSGIFMLLYGLLPDESRNSGYLSSRLAVIGQHMWLAGGALVLVILPSAVRRMVMAVVLCLLPFRVAYYVKVERSLGREVAEFRESARYITPGSVVHQVNFSGNWLHEHLSMSVCGKNIIHLKNYEAYLDYFPLGWRHESIQTWMTHAQYWKNWPPCPDSAELIRLSQSPLPDYLIVWDEAAVTKNAYPPDDVCRTAVMDWLRRHYLCSHTSSQMRMHLMKRRPEAAESGIEFTPDAANMFSARRSWASSE